MRPHLEMSLLLLYPLQHDNNLSPQPATRWIMDCNKRNGKSEEQGRVRSKIEPTLLFGESEKTISECTFLLRSRPANRSLTAR